MFLYFLSGEEVEKAYRSLDKSKRGYQRAFQEWETAQTAYRRAEADGTVSRWLTIKIKSPRIGPFLPIVILMSLFSTGHCLE